MLMATEKSPFYENGLCFSCKRCSACCRFESGYVFLSEKDVSLLAVVLNMDHNVFIETYCRWISMGKNKYNLSLKEKSNFDCIFWEKGAGENGACSVYKSRPLQCQSFPFWPSVVISKKSWENAGKDCPGIGKGHLHSRNTIDKWLALRETEPIMSRGVS